VPWAWRTRKARHLARLPRAALARFETALKIGGADSVARKLLSRTARELADETLASRPAEARAVLQRAIAASPDDAETHACVALAHTIA